MLRMVMTVGFGLALAGCEGQRSVEAPGPGARPSQAAGLSAQAASQPASRPHAAAANAQGGAGIRGTVLETMNAAGYTYLRLQTDSGSVWAAVTETTLAVGARVELPDAMLMRNFESKTLNRTFEEIYFGALASGRAPTGAAPSNAAASQPAAGRTLTGELPPGHPPMNAPATTVAEVKVERATGPGAKTVAEVWAERAKLKDQKITLRGQVVKASNGILGKNWLHLRDGSGSAAAKDNDLLVTTAAFAAVGDVVTVEGSVRLDQDFGAGYAYAVLVEDATVRK